MQIIRSLYLEEGFVDVKVQAPESFLSLDKRTISVVFDVEEGPKYKVGKIDVRGDFVEEEGLSKAAVMRVIQGDMAKTISERWKRVSGEEKPEDGWEQPIKEWLDFRATHPKLESEETFKLTALQITMQELSKLYGDQGYAFANVVPLTDTDAETGIVDVTFDIRKGDKVKINRISISGNDPTYDKVIRRDSDKRGGSLFWHRH